MMFNSMSVLTPDFESSVTSVHVLNRGPPSGTVNFLLPVAAWIASKVSQAQLELVKTITGVGKGQLVFK